MFTFHYKAGLGLFPVIFHLCWRANICSRFKRLSIRTLREQQQKVQENIIHKISNKIMKQLNVLVEQTSPSLITSCCGVVVVGKAGGPV